MATTGAILGQSWPCNDSAVRLAANIIRARDAEVRRSIPRHIVQLSRGQTEQLRAWLVRPNGAHSHPRVTFEAVVDGGILVRTSPYTYPARPDKIIDL